MAACRNLDAAGAGIPSSCWESMKGAAWSSSPPATIPSKRTSIASRSSRMVLRRSASPISRAFTQPFSRRTASTSVRASQTAEGEMQYTVYRGDGTPAGKLSSVAEKLPFVPKIEYALVGDEPRLHAAIIRPRAFDAARRYPVIVHIYGGPTAQMVTIERRRYLLESMDRRSWVHRGFDRRPRHARRGSRVGAGHQGELHRAAAGRPGARAEGTGRKISRAGPLARRHLSAGRSAAMLRRWPSCSGPTCFTSAWRARRSSTGPTTTRTTPSATSGCPRRTPPATRPAPC